MTLYRTIVADPPWPIAWSMGTTRVNGRGERHRTIKRDLGYPTMSIEDICALPVGDLAEPDAHLYLWVTPKFNREGVGAKVARAWGFEVFSEIVPDAFLDLVESASPGPYLELFARRKRLGWHVWGNEVDSDVDFVTGAAA